MQSRFHDIGGEDFHALHWGREAAPAILLLHGFPEYSGAWIEVAERLADRFHLIAPDQRGYGQSPAPPDVASYALGRLVDDMARLIESVCGRCILVGHDWGAAVAYGLAIARPDLVDRLVILNGVHPVPFQRALASGGAQSAASAYIEYLRREGAEDRLAADEHAAMTRLFSAKMDLRWLNAERLAAYRHEWARPGRLRGMVNWYRASPLVPAAPGVPVQPPALPEHRLRIAMPHLLIWGENDTALLPEATRGLEDFCDAGLTRARIAGADHWLCHQKPDDVAEAIAGFAGLPPAAL